MRISDWSSDVCSSDLKPASGMTSKGCSGFTCDSVSSAKGRAPIKMRLPVASASILLESRRSPPTFRAAHRSHDAILPAMSDPLADDPFDDPQVSRHAVAPRPAPYLAALNDSKRAAVEEIGRASGRERVCQYV